MRITQNRTRFLDTIHLQRPEFLFGAPAALTCTWHFEPTRLLISSTTRHKHSRDAETVEAKYALHLKIFHPIRLPVKWKPHSGWVTQPWKTACTKGEESLFTYLFISLISVWFARLSSATNWALIHCFFYQNGGNRAAGQRESEPSGAAPAWPRHTHHSGISQCPIWSIEQMCPGFSQTWVASNFHSH